MYQLTFTLDKKSGQILASSDFNFPAKGPWYLSTALQFFCIWWQRRFKSRVEATVNRALRLIIIWGPL